VIDELSALGLLNNPSAVKTVVKDVYDDLLEDGYKGEQELSQLEEAKSAVERKYRELEDILQDIPEDEEDMAHGAGFLIPPMNLKLIDPWGLRPSLYARHRFRVWASIHVVRRHEDQRVVREYWVRYVPEQYGGSELTMKTRGLQAETESWLLMSQRRRDVETFSFAVVYVWSVFAAACRRLLGIDPLSLWR
jgi:hypothetical protein